MGSLLAHVDNDLEFSELVIKGIRLLNVSITDSNFCFERALKTANKMNDKHKKIFCLISLASNYNKISDHSIAIGYLDKAMKLAGEIECDKVILMNVYTQYAIAHDGLKEFVTSISYLEKALKLAQEFGNNETMLVCNMMISFDYIELKQFWNCIYYLEKALKLAEGLGDTERILSCYFGLGIIYNYQFEYQKAIDYLEKALPLMMRFGDKPGESDCYLSLSTAYNNISNHNKALMYSENALRLKIILGDKLGESNCYLQNGIAYKELLEYQKAIMYMEKALPLKIEIGDKMGETECYTNLGLVYFNLSNYQKAIMYLEKALVLAEDIHNKYERSTCYINLGLVYFNLSNYQKAIMYFEKALQIKIEIGDRMGEAICYGNMGNFYYYLSNFDQSRNYYRMSLEISRQIGDKKSEMYCYLNLGNTYIEHDNPNVMTGLDYIEKGLIVAKQIDDKKLSMIFYVSLGRCLTLMGEPYRAIEHFQNALDIATKIGDQTTESLIGIYIAISYSSMDDSNRAIEHFRYALDIATKIGDQGRIGLIRGYLGILLFELGQFELSYTYLKDAIIKSELIGNDLLDNQFKIYYYGKDTALYECMISACISLKYFAEAYEYVIRSKSKAFLELLTTSSIRSADPNIEEYIKEEEILLNKKRSFQSRYLRNDFSVGKFGNKSSESNASYEELTSVDQELEAFYLKLEKINPHYVSLGRLKVTTINEIQKSIDGPEVILVEYYLTNKQIYLFIVTKNSFNVKIVISDNQKFNDCIRNYLAEVVDYDQFVHLGLPFTNLWKDIGKYLLEPLEEHLKRMKVIYFIPHHILHYLPFHALELNSTPLIKNYGVVYLQSATLLEFYNDTNTKPISCNSIGVYKGNEESFFHKEVKAIAGMYNTTALIDAPKSEILENMNKDLLHFATHGKYNHQDPLDSEITLNENERLTVREIFDLNLNLDLVTISACESGFNKYHPGDELTGLARAFTYAGARSMVISLWKVYDPSTYEFMLRFYRNMNGGMNKVSALQDAQISLMEYKKYSHPHFWAPFILIGNSK